MFIIVVIILIIIIIIIIIIERYPNFPLGLTAYVLCLNNYIYCIPFLQRKILCLQITYYVFLFVCSEQ